MISNMSQRRSLPEPERPAGLFVRVPAEHARLLDRAAANIPARKKDIIAGLLARHVDPDTPRGVAALRELATPGGLPRRPGVEAEDARLETGEHSFLPNPPLVVLDVGQAGELLGVEARIVAELAERGEIPGRKIGHEWRFSRQGLLDWLSHRNQSTG